MLLSAVAGGLRDAGIDHTVVGDAELTDVVHHSDRHLQGALFCCVPGSRVDGHDLAEEVLAAGAAALLVERRLDVDAPQLVVPSVRAAMGPVSARFWGDPSHDLRVVGVTGTNGKTTTVALVRAIARAAGLRCEVIGTLSPTPGGPPTTPDAPELQATLAGWRDAGIDVVAMEVSSHALAMGRVDGTRFAAAGFTTLGHDHLDFHGDMATYFEAKASLFEPERTAHAVVRADDEWGARLAERLRHVDGVELHEYRLDDAEELEATARGTRMRWRGVQVELPLTGLHNVANAVCAAELARCLGLEDAVIGLGLDAVEPVPGRFELVDLNQPFTVAVDYAHTPDALATVLAAARARARARGGRVLVVFGCGGDKDRAKRPEMGRIAATSADVVVVTSDNPRTEDPVAIIDEILAGIPDHLRDVPWIRPIPDRAEAIHHVTREARNHDVVVIAGKGHETTQTFADRVEHFDDRLVAAEAIAEVMGWGGDDA